MLDSVKMLEKANKNRTVIKYRERVELEVVKDTKHYKKRQKIAPHKLVADELVNLGVAKPIKK